MNLGACASLVARPEKSTWYRAVPLKYWRAALSTAHTSGIPSRFNEGLNQYEILYLGEDSMVAMFESQALLGSPYGAWVQGPRKNWLIVSVEVRLQNVADLTRVSQQSLLDTTAQELTGDWRGYQLRGPAMPVSQPAATPAPTQQLGEMMHAVSGLEAFVSLSPRVPTHRILVVFPKKLEPGSELIFTRDDTGKIIQRLRHTRRRRESRS